MKPFHLVTLLITLAGCEFDPAGLTGEPSADAGPVVDPCAAEEIEAEATHTCARRGDGTVLCWGFNGSGQVGSPGQAPCPGNALDCNPLPAPVGALPPVVELALGEAHSCAVTADRRTFCWGDNTSGQFGGGAVGVRPAPVAIEGRGDALEMVGGEAYTCSRDGGGAIWCSGRNAYGELGVGSTEPSELPVEIPAVTASGLAGGERGVCAIRADDGQVLCWGANDLGQLDATSVGQDVLSPIPITGVTGAVAIAAGGRHGCAVLGDASAMCWGDNGAGQLGNGELGSPSAAIAIGVPPPITALATAADHTCAVRDGLVLCWGDGYGAAPVAVELPAAAIDLTAGGAHDCAILDDRTVWCWGWNGYGQLGDGTFTDPGAPVEARLCEE